ncbi:MAG: hypothetical protein WCK21_05905 [Actinomycetota bacterium]
MATTGSTIAPRRLTRVDLANAMVELVWGDRSLANAITINEAWSSGYIARLLTRAETIAASSVNHDPRGSEPLTAFESVRQAIDIANPRGALERVAATIHDDAREALVALLQAQARFHSVAAPLERRGLRRVPIPA